MDKRLKDFIKTTRLNYLEFGEKIGYSEAKVKMLANGKQRITPDIALEIEEGYKVNPCWLIFGRGSMIPVGFDLSEDAELGSSTAKPTMTNEELTKMMLEFKEELKNR